jgi:membrane protein DedA with SNARE-associated domain
MKLSIVYVPVSDLRASEYNPRKWSKEQLEGLTESIRRFDVVDPIVVNGADDRKNVVIGGHMRLAALKLLGRDEVPVVYLALSPEKEKELNIRLNRNTGEFDFDLLAKYFEESTLSEYGFTSEELDDVFAIDPIPETFDLKKELEKLKIDSVKVQKGDVYEINGSRLMCGDSTIEADMLKLMEVTMPFSGFLAQQGILNVWIVILVGTMANLAGSLLAYWIGYVLEETVLLRLIKRYGKFVLIDEKEYRHAEHWFKRYGDKIVLVSRLLPGIRTVISLPAGAFRMDLKKFIIYTTVGCLVWSAILTYIGYVLGENWNTLDVYYRKFEIVIVVGLVIGVLWYVNRKLHFTKKIFKK